jgi:quercetin dioxygenase-like cupin family protein
MSHSIVDVDEIPYVWGTFKFVRHHIGATGFGVNQIDFPPDKAGPEHDEATSGQEEVYLTLAGSGTLEIDGEIVEMKIGRYILVAPGSKRRPTAGADGMSFLVIGGVPGGVYEPWTPPEE